MRMDAVERLERSLQRQADEKAMKILTERAQKLGLQQVLEKSVDQERKKTIRKLAVLFFAEEIYQVLEIPIQEAQKVLK